MNRALENGETPDVIARDIGHKLSMERRVGEPLSFDPVFRLCFRVRLPLHVDQLVRAAPLEGDYLIDDVSRAGSGRRASGWTRALSAERASRR